MINLNICEYIKKVWMNVVVVSILSTIVPFLLNEVTEESFIRFIWLTIVCLINVVMVEFFVGCNSKEREFVTTKMSYIISKLKLRK